ncbi:alpha-galactosidase, partial [Kineococcus glutinatus]|uniref:alpha-galactosidase n=1 Tax=Kineococcus glutinatus TaxID=1070872 RepID=UPI0031ED7EAA
MTTAAEAAQHTTHDTIALGNGLLEVVLAHDAASPVRVLRWGPPGASGDLPASQPAVEIVTADAGRAPATGRLVGAVASGRLRYRGHDLHREGERQVLLVEQHEDGGSLRVRLRVELPDGVAAARCSVHVENAAGADAPRVLLSVASLALAVGVGPLAEGRPEALELSSARSAWLGESRWSTQPLRRAGLPDVRLAAHGQGARGCVALTSAGSWSTGRALPTGVLAAADGTGALAWQVEHPGGWRWEVGEHREGAYLALSGPTDDDHAWSTVLAPGGSFGTVPVTVAVGDDLTAAVAALTAHRRAVRRPHPDATALPVVFNDYMNTLMGDPTTAALLPLVDAAAEAGAEVFCIDAGWYDDGGDWWTSVGEWQPSTTRFPGGLQEVLDHVRHRDMTPGLWLEPEVVGVDSPVADRLPAEAFLHRHGRRVVEHGRYHLDLRHPAAVAHLDEVVDRLVSWGVGYLKLDHNINPGPGTDVAADSPGAGLLGHARAHRAWLAAVLDRHPHLVLENCASGAMRADAALLELLQLQSTSDQQDPAAYPPIAAAAPLSIPLEQAANWAYPQPSMDDEEICATLATAVLGRFYLSGHLDGMSVAQRSLVADAVAAHKRLRAGLAAGRACWPLGIDQWERPWVALAVDTGANRGANPGENPGGDVVTHLTLWRRPGAGEVVEVPLPEHAGHDLVVDTAFPARLEPWRHEWDRERGVLRVTATSAAPSARVLRLTRGPALQRVVVHADRLGEPVHGGATGMLYGLSDDGVPAPALLAGARPRTVAQKPPGGAQHPGGDAAEIAGGFLAAGGEEVLVYLQDALRRWPYEDVGIDAYRALVREAVRHVAARPDRHRFVWVPFNEGDWIWYRDWSPAGRERFLADWTAVFRDIRAIDPAARIAGPNESRYHPHRVRDFLVHARDTGTLPDVVTWHELQPSSLEVYPAHHAHLRALERELGVGPLPVNVDEYGNRRDTSVPGQLLQWVEALETTKADGDLAYWTLAGNLDDHAVGQAAANGGWWLLHWYASLRGRTAAVDVPHPRVRDSLRALAAVDDDARTTTVLVGGTRDAVEVEVRGLPGGALRLRTAAVTWTGYEGELAAPAALGDVAVRAAGGVLRLRLPGGDPFAVHRVDVTPDGGGEPLPPGPWTSTTGFDEAVVVGCPRVRYGDDPQQYAGTGRRGVAAMPSADSAVSVAVQVPETGRYLLGVGYGTDAVPGRLALAVDGRAHGVLELPATLARGYTGRVDVPVHLTAGTHVVRLATTAGGAVLPGSDVALDHVRLELLPEGASTRWDAVFAGRSAGARVVFGGARRGPGAVELPAGEELAFFVGTRRRGAHRLELVADAPGGRVVLVVGGRRVAAAALAGSAGVVVALPRGVSHVVVAGADGLLVHCLQVRDEVDGHGPAAVVGAGDLEPAGGARRGTAG